MSEIVECVAAAIRKVNEDAVGLRYTDLTRAMARAAIEAMREPTEAMMVDHSQVQITGYRSMIDEALS